MTILYQGHTPTKANADLDAIVASITAAIAGGTAYTDAARVHSGSRTVTTLATYNANNAKFNAKDYDGLVVGDDWQPALAAANTDAVVDGSPVGIPARATAYPVNEDLTLAAYAPTPGAVLKPASGKNIHFGGQTHAGHTQIVDLSSGGTVTFDRRSTSKLKLAWFALYTDGILDTSATWNAAIACAWASGITKISALAGDYVVGSTIEWFEGLELVAPKPMMWYRATPGNGSPYPNGVCLKPTGTCNAAVRLAASSATPTPTYTQVTAAMGGTIANLTVDMTNAPASGRAFSIEGGWFVQFNDLKVLGFTTNTQVGFWLGNASISAGSCFWNKFNRCEVYGDPLNQHGIAWHIEGANDGSIHVPTQTSFFQCHTSHVYSGLEMNYCGSGFTFYSSTWEGCTINGVTITNPQGGAQPPVFIGCEMSSNGGYGISGYAHCHDCKAAANALDQYDSSVHWWDVNTAVGHGWYQTSLPISVPLLMTNWGLVNTVAAGGSIDPSKGGMQRISGTAGGGAVTLDATTPILPGKQGQFLVLVGGSATDTVTIPNSGTVKFNSVDSFTPPLNGMAVFGWDRDGGKWIELSISPTPGFSSRIVNVNTLTAGAILDPTAGNSQRLSAAAGGGPITLNSTTPIANGTHGQLLVLTGGSDTDTVTVPNETAGGTNIRVRGGAFTLQLNYGMLLLFDNYAGKWIEQARSPQLFTPVTFGASHSLVIADHNCRLRFVLSGSTARTVTLDSTLPAGFRCSLGRLDAAAATLTLSGAGCTINTPTALAQATYVLPVNKSIEILHAGSGVYDIIAAT